MTPLDRHGALFSLDSRLDKVLVYARARLGRGDATSAWVAGSIAAGLGNSRSDVDLFLAVATPGPLPPVEQVMLGGLRVDVEFRVLAQVRKRVDQLRRPLLREHGFDMLPSTEVLDDLCRLFYAVPVEETAEHLVADVRSLEHQLRRCRLLRSVSIFASKSEDVQGALESVAHRQALEISSRLLLEALEAFLASAGSYYMGVKWVFEKLERLPNSDYLLAHLDRALDQPGMSPTKVIVASRVELAQHLLAGALSAGWTSAGGVAWLRVFSEQGPQPRLMMHPQWTPGRFDDSVLLEGWTKKEHLQVSGPGLLLWSLASLFPADEAADRLCDLAGDLAMGELVQHEALDYVDALVRHGLLTERSAQAGAS